jgi:hypothetical protein
MASFGTSTISHQPPVVRCLRMLILFSIAGQPCKAQTAEAAAVTVTGEAVPTPTPHDNWREMRQHIMPEVSGTEITVTKKATVIKLEQQPPVENNNQQELFTKAPGSHGAEPISVKYDVRL